MAISVIESCSSIINKLRGMIETYNTISSVFGGKTINIDTFLTVDGINNVRNKALEAVNNNFKQYEHLNTLDLNKWNAAADLLGNKIKDFRLSDIINKTKEELKGLDPNSLDKTNYQDILDNVNSMAGNTSDIRNSLDIAEEDLKYLRDIAERDTINKFTTVPLSIEINNNNSINGEQDIDGIVDRVCL